MAEQEPWPALLKDLSIANFRGIREGKLENLAQVNIIAGRNNSGKSTILEALILAKHPIQPGDRLGRGGAGQLLFNRRTERSQRHITDLWFRLDRQEEVKVNVQFATGHSFDTRLDPNNETVAMGFKGKDSESSWGRVQDLFLDAGFSARYDGLGWQGTPKGLGCIKALGEALLIDSGTVRDMGIVEKHLWPPILVKRADKRIRAEINEIYDLNIEFFSMTEGRLYVALPTFAIPIEVLGDGVKFTFNLLCAAASLRDTMLLIEEPESHQHPEGLQRSLLALLKVCKENRIQVLMTTHSLEAITYTLDTCEKEGLEAKLYHVSLGTEGKLEARGVNGVDARILMDVGTDPRMVYKYTGW